MCAELLKLTLIFNITRLSSFSRLSHRRGAMIVCHCRRVSDRTIRAAVQAGADTEDAVSEVCGAGSRCGRCLPAVSELIDSERPTGRSLRVLTSAA